MRFISMALAAAFVLATPAGAQPVQPITKADPYVAVPGGVFLASNAHNYRVVFEAQRPAAKPDQLTPIVDLAGSEMNTLAAHRIERSNVHFVIVFHTPDANDAVLDNAHYRAKFGVDNPNLPSFAELRRDGVEIYVCGQSLLGSGVPLAAVAKDVKIAEDGLVVLMTLGSEGYAHITY